MKALEELTDSDLEILSVLRRADLEHIATAEVSEELGYPTSQALEKLRACPIISWLYDTSKPVRQRHGYAIKIADWEKTQVFLDAWWKTRRPK